MPNERALPACRNRVSPLSFEPQPEEKDKIFEKEIFIFENKWKKNCFAVIVMEELRQHTPSSCLFLVGVEDEGQFAVQY